MQINKEKLYDRQIQIFGGETQKTINSTEVMVFGLNTVTTEIVKNLALIGFNIAVCDNKPLGREDIDNSPLLGKCDEDCLNQPLDTVIKNKLLDINPCIEVRVVTEPSGETLTDSTSILVSTSQSFEAQRSLSDKFRETKMHKFYLFESADSFLAVAELPEKSFKLHEHDMGSFREKLKQEHGIDYSFDSASNSYLGDFVLRCAFGATFNQTLLTLISRQKLAYNLLYLNFNQKTENPSEHRKLDCLCLN